MLAYNILGICRNLSLQTGRRQITHSQSWNQLITLGGSCDIWLLEMWFAVLSLLMLTVIEATFLIKTERLLAIMRIFFPPQ